MNKRFDAHQQPALNDIKQFFLSCGNHMLVNDNDNEEVSESGSTMERPKQFNHAKMALTILQKLRKQRCRLKKFTPLPVEISTLFIRACIRSGHPEIGTSNYLHIQTFDINQSVKKTNKKRLKDHKVLDERINTY